MPEPTSPPIAPPRVWSPFGITWISLLLSPLTGGVLHALNERSLGRERSWRATLYRNLLLGVLLLRPGLLKLTMGPGSLRAGNMLIAMYFYKSQSDLFAQHVATGGAPARFGIPVLVTLGAYLLYIVLVGI